MAKKHRVYQNTLQYIAILAVLAFLASCSIPVLRKVPKDRAFLRKNKIEISGPNLTKAQKTDIQQRLFTQLEDSSRVPSKESLLFFEVIKNPPVYDSIYSRRSVSNMKATLFHMGYYRSTVDFTDDTVKRQVYVKYHVNTGPPTRIDTVNYRLRKPALQEIAIRSKSNTELKEQDPVSKIGIQTEINRLVDSFRNQGYYKFTAAEIKVKGDTSIEALTSLSNDPFEQLNLLADAARQIDSPKIKLSIDLNPPVDTTKLIPYYINNIYVLSDYHLGDKLQDSLNITQTSTRNFIHRYHENLFKTSFLARVITLKSGTIYRQDEYYTTISNLSKMGVWDRIDIQVIEISGTDKVDLVIELMPAMRLGFEAALEASYSASIGTGTGTAGNLFGVSGNLSLTNRNVGREAIRMSHKVRAGIEFNSNKGSTGNIINSNEISYTNNLTFPRLLFPNFIRLFAKNKDIRNLPRGESFINSNIAYSKRLDLYNQQATGAQFGWGWNDKRNNKWVVKPLNVEFSYLFNQTDSFNTILAENPFLRYSFKTAYVVGMGAGFSKTYNNPWHPSSKLKERSIRLNFEESGLTWANLGILKNYLRRYVKFDSEYKYSVSYNKTALAFRLFVGVGVPLLGSDTNRTLPFFKQYQGGGSISMKGWPIRGIGVGGQPQAPFENTGLYNDRTGDMQIEGNVEYRYDIARIIPNTLTLGGAFFIDAGNIWNIRNSKFDGTTDTSQFMFKNLYSQLGISAGTGLRLDFKYIVLRLDFGFRFKRPDLYYTNNGWKAPDIGFDDFLKKLFTRGENDEYRIWRYENYNFSIGIGYAF